MEPAISSPCCLSCRFL